MRQFLKQYLTEKQVCYLQSGRLREVVTLRELTGYGCHRNMQISRDFRTSKLLGSFKQLKQILNFDKFEPPLCGFQFSYLKLIVKTAVTYFRNMLTQILHRWVILSQDSRIESRLQWISFAVSFIDPSETQGMCTFWQKNRYLYRLEKSSGSWSFVQPNNDRKKINGYE